MSPRALPPVRRAAALLAVGGEILAPGARDRVVELLAHGGAEGGATPGSAHVVAQLPEEDAGGFAVLAQGALALLVAIEVDAQSELIEDVLGKRVVRQEDHLVVDGWNGSR